MTNVKIKSLLLILLFSSLVIGFDFRDAPYKIELGNYYSGLAVWKKNNAHYVKASLHLEETAYPQLRYGYANTFRLHLGSKLNVSSKDGYFEHIFSKGGVGLELKTNPFNISVTVLDPRLTHTTIMYDDVVGISYADQHYDQRYYDQVSQSKESLKRVGVFLRFPFLFSEIFGQYGSMSYGDKVGTETVVGIGQTFQVNQVKHYLSFEMKDVSWDSDPSMIGFKYEDYLADYYHVVNTFRLTTQTSSRVRYNCAIPLQTMTFRLGVDRLSEGGNYIVKLGHDYFISDSFGLLTQLFVGSSLEEEGKTDVLFRMRLVFKK